MSREVDEIKQRLDIIDIVGEYVQLKKAGTNWKAPCPFHNEKTPSFMVSRDKQIWHCFGCSEGGDLISFVQKIEGLEFPEVLKLLAQKAGVELPTYDPKAQSQRNRLIDICREAMRFWHHTLLEGSAGEQARQYLQQRKVSEASIEDFQLGYAHESWDALLQHLQGKGYKDQEIFLAGLAIKKERGQGFYDRFRNRIVFPIMDTHGNPVGFSGRTLSSDEQAKYINTPQTQLYNKSAVIFNLDKAKQTIRKNDSVIIVEGQMDVVAVYQNGQHNVVAVSGTAFTTEQLQLLQRYTNNLLLAFDTDVAGESASRRSIDLALAQEFNVKVIVLPTGKDPDECIATDPEVWMQASQHPKSIMEYFFGQVKARHDLTTVEGKKAAAVQLLGSIAKLGNPIEQTHWLQQLSGLLSVPEEILRERLPSRQRQVTPQRQQEDQNSSKQAVEVPKSRSVQLAEGVLALSLRYPEHFGAICDNLDVEMIPSQELRGLYKDMIIYYTNATQQPVDFDTLLSQLDENKQRLASLLALLADKDFGEFSHDEALRELKTLAVFLKKHYYSQKLKLIQSSIREAESQGDTDALDSLTHEFASVSQQIKSLE